MAKALCEDLRDRVIRAIEAGASRREAAKRFGVGPSSAVKWHRRWRETGALAPSKLGNPGGRKLAPHRELILALIDAQPDLRLHQLRQHLAEHGIVIGFGSIWRFLDDEGISFKNKADACRAGA
jgi:transposase